MAQITGTDLNDTLTGTQAADLIRGFAGDDQIEGSDGVDHLYGGAGHDVLRAGDNWFTQARNLLSGGSGDDQVWGVQGNDTLLGGSGNDWIWGAAVTLGKGIDQIRGGDGNDRITISGSATVAVGGEGQDVFVIRSGNNTIDGSETGRWVDTVDYSNSETRVSVNLARGTALTFGPGHSVGHDTLLDIEFVQGSAGNDRLIGGNAANDDFEAFIGGQGGDTIRGGSGHDVLLADHGWPQVGVTVDLRAGFAIDIFGDRDQVHGIEEVYASDFADVLSGNRADNRFSVYGGDDRIDGRHGYDSISFFGMEFAGSAGVTVDLRTGVATGAGAKVLLGIESVGGTERNDLLLGKGNSNSFSSGPGDDRIAGRGGNDGLFGGAGDDRLTGGAGADYFGFAAGSGRDVITDFTPGVDLLALQGLGPVTAAEALDLARQNRQDVVFSFADGTELTLRHVLLVALTEGDFLF